MGEEELEEEKVRVELLGGIDEGVDKEATTSEDDWIDGLDGGILRVDLNKGMRRKKGRRNEKERGGGTGRSPQSTRMFFKIG